MGTLLPSGIYVPDPGEWGSDHLDDNWELVDAHLMDSGSHGGGGGGVSLGGTVVSETSFGSSAVPGSAGTASRVDHTHGTPTNPVTAHVALPDAHHPKAHNNDHATGGADAFAVGDLLDAIARVGVRKGTGTTFNRRRLSVNEGAGMTITVTDDAANEEVDITFEATGAGEAGAPDPHTNASHNPGTSVFSLLSGSAGEQALGGGHLSWTPSATPSSPTSGRKLHSDTDNGSRLTAVTSTGQEINLETANIATAAGDLLYASGAGVLTRLPIGATNDVLRVNAGVPDWEALGTLAYQVSFMASAGNTTFTPGASASLSVPVEWFRMRRWLNLTGYSQFRWGLSVTQDFDATTKANIQYSTNSGSTWLYPGSTDAATELTVSGLSATSTAPVIVKTGVLTLDSAAAADCLWRVVFSLSIASPTAGGACQVWAEFL